LAEGGDDVVADYRGHSVGLFMATFSRQLWQRFLALASPYWRSDEKGVAWALLVLLILLMFGEAWSNVLFNQQTGELTSALAAKDADRFWRNIYECLAVLIIAVPICGLYYFVRDLLSNRWRRWLTRHLLDRYFSNRAYYELNVDSRIDNPDQRIAQDAGTFTQKSLYFLLVMLGCSIEVIAFSGVLWNISRPLVCFLLVYALIGTTVTMLVFGRMLIGLNSLQLKKEADFRFGLVRIRENAESIALHRGENQERGQLEQRFDSLFRNYRRLINRQLLLNLFAYAYNYLTLVIPIAIIAGSVLSGELEVGRAVQAAGAFRAILKALTIIVDKFDELSQFSAGIERLDTFVNFLEIDLPRRKTKSAIQVFRGKQLVINRLSLRTPDNRRWIVQQLNAAVRPGENLMIVGQSGCGKSTLLRAIAGLASAGSGTIARPGLNHMLFLPQRPYMVLGNLRNQLLYPFPGRYRFDEELLEVLEQVNLQRLPDQYGGLDAEADWGNVLSIGEQQRLAIARVLLARPRYVMLDEATSALDESNEQRLYQLLADTACTLISVSHREALRDYHQKVLELAGDGRWQLQPARQFSATG
jgi:putative ATP-binding cassette transporter